MPELPDVEGFRRVFTRYGQDRAVERVEVLDRELVRNRSPQALGRALKGERFGSPRRHGKWLIAPAGNVEVLLHFGMTGALEWSSSARDRHRHDRVIFVFEDGELRYNNMRRFGGIWLARNADEREQVTGPLGPDATRLDLREFTQLLGPRRGTVKSALMDQRLIAGVGNLLSDEILWRARIYPGTPVRELGTLRRRRLHDALRAAVGESSRYGRVPHGQRWLTRVRDDPGASCPRCGTALRRGRMAGRTACWCPRCQRARV
jgi:formamidopyrimidine-DNA glycosylase